MSAVLSLSPTPIRVIMGQGFSIRAQVRDSEVRRPYDLTGAGAIVCKLISLSGGTARTLAAAPTIENATSGTLVIVGSVADTSALTPGRWYFQLSIPTVAEGGGATLIPDIYPFDVVASQ